MLSALHSAGIKWAIREHSRMYPKRKPIRGQYKVFVPIRETVSRNISAFFMDYYKEGHTLTADKFIHRYHHSHGIIWIEREIGGYWGLDVYSTPFDTSRGWQRYKIGDASILIIRMENYGTGWEEAYKTFMGTELVPVMLHQNATSEKHKLGQAKEYKRFLEKETIPDYYINWVNSSRYMQHFYPDMIEQKASSNE